MRFNIASPREELVQIVQELERLTERKDAAANRLREMFETAQARGFDKITLKVVLKLRTMTPSQRAERKALEAIYMAALGMLEGEALPEAARRHLDEPAPTDQNKRDEDDDTDEAETTEVEPRLPELELPPESAPAQQPLVLKEPAEARAEGEQAAAEGKRIYDNPYPAGDPCRAAWDEGWCSAKGAHGMETPSAFQRRADKPARKDEGQDGNNRKGGEGSGDSERGAA